MTDTTAPNTGTTISVEQIHDLIAQLKTFNDLLAELLRDRDQPAISDVIRDHLIAEQRIETSFTAAAKHLIAALRRQETLDRSTWDQAILERLRRLVTCHGIFPRSAIRVRPMERTDDEEGTTDGRADYRHPAGA